MDSIQKAVMKIAHSVTDQKELIIKEWMEINGEIISEYTDIYCVDGIIKRLNEIYELRVENERLKRNIIAELINTIESELSVSESFFYIPKDSDSITTDVGNIQDWFDEYKDVLRKRYGLE
nr:MAG TPA: hypothetical protein [Caudoviricetes sp.]